MQKWFLLTLTGMLGVACADVEIVPPGSEKEKQARAAGEAERQAKIAAAREHAARRRNLPLSQRTLRNTRIVAELGSRLQVLHRNPDVFVVDDVLAEADRSKLAEVHTLRREESPMTSNATAWCFNVDEMKTMRGAYAKSSPSTAKTLPSDLVREADRPRRVGPDARCVNVSLLHRERWAFPLQEAGMTVNTLWRAGESAAVDAALDALETQLGLPRAQGELAMLAQTSIQEAGPASSNYEARSARHAWTCEDGFAASVNGTAEERSPCKLEVRIVARSGPETTVELPELGISIPARLGMAIVWESSANIYLDLNSRPIELGYTRHPKSDRTSTENDPIAGNALLLHQTYVPQTVAVAPIIPKDVVVCDRVEGCTAFVAHHGGRAAFERLSRALRSKKRAEKSQLAHEAAAALRTAPSSAAARYALSVAAHRASNVALGKLNAFGARPPAAADAKARKAWHAKRQVHSTDAQERLYESLCQLRGFVRLEPPSAKHARTFIGEVFQTASVVAKETARESGIRAYLLSAEIAVIQARGLYDSGAYEEAAIALQPVTAIAERDAPAKKVRREAAAKKAAKKAAKRAARRRKRKAAGKKPTLRAITTVLRAAHLEAQLYSGEEDIVDLNERIARMVRFHSSV